MIFTVKKADLLQGTVRPPASKSYSIRAFIVGACGGTSTIIHPSLGYDVRVAMNVAAALGAQIQRKKPNIFRISAFKKPLRIKRIDVRESGTVLRLLLPLLSLYEGKSLVVGEGTLQRRPNLYLIQALRRMGVDIEGRGRQHTVPILKKEGRLHGGAIKINGSLSSQFVSAFLIACPFLPEDTLLTITGANIVSRTYITMTQQILKKAGISIVQKTPRLFYIPGNQTYKGLRNFIVPSDYGLAAFFLAAAILLRSKVFLEGYWVDDPIQADGRILDFLRQMGARFTKTKDHITISGPFEISGGEFSLKDCPDLVPIMTILALFARGKTRLYDIGHVRTKESDRIAGLSRELLKIGAKIIAKPNEMVIYPQKIYREGCLLDSHHDHRLAMSFCILGLKLAVKIKDIESTAKSYPAFVQDLKRLGGIRTFHRVSRLDNNGMSVVK